MGHAAYTGCFEIGVDVIAGSRTYNDHLGSKTGMNVVSVESAELPGRHFRGHADTFKSTLKQRNARILLGHNITD